MASVAKDLTVHLRENRPGRLARAIEALSDAGLNIDGYSELDGTFHVLTKNPQAAREALEAAGFEVRSEQDALIVPVEDRPGAAAAVLLRLAEGGVNVTFSYLATNNRMVIGVDDPGRARELISG